MAEDLKALIEKIQKEGIETAEEKARAIIDGANKKAASIIREAEEKARGIIAQAESRVAQMEEKTRSSLRQAGRDLLLSLRKEINAMLEAIIIKKVRQALTPDEIVHILTSLIQEHISRSKTNIVVSLRKDDLDPLKQSLFHELKEATRRGITLVPSDDIRSGFTISYDNGRSFYDFTDKALAEYIGTYVKPQLEALLKESVGTPDDRVTP